MDLSLSIDLTDRDCPLSTNGDSLTGSIYGFFWDFEGSSFAHNDH